MDHGPATPTGRRSRDRRGRGLRGPGVLPLVPGQPVGRSQRQRFDRIVLDLIGQLEERWHDRLGLLEYAVEDTPTLPDDWAIDTVPLSSLVRGSGATPTRLVLFRRPLEHRAESLTDLHALTLTVLVEQVAELLGLPPEDVDPRYRPRE